MSGSHESSLVLPLGSVLVYWCRGFLAGVGSGGTRSKPSLVRKYCDDVFWSSIKRRKKKKAVAVYERTIFILE